MLLRRRFLGAMLAGGAAAPAWPQALVGADAAGQRLLPWQPGRLDIHHIATGRGNATLVLMPDGSSLLIDAGSSTSELDVSAAPRPDASRRAGEWIARYAQRQLAPTGRRGIDQALITHLHPDHLGAIERRLPTAAAGTHLLTGIAEVAELLPIGTLFDRAFPDYDTPMARQTDFGRNYVAFVEARVKAGQRVERFIAGRDDQLRMASSAPGLPRFRVRNIAANGAVWSGEGQGSRSRVPPAASLGPADQPDENMLSAALRIEYGGFRYFTGGDLTGYTFDGEQPWRDVLGEAARVAGPVDAATADHHGMFDGLNADVVRRLRPRVWVIPTWHITHPDTLQLERMLSERLYPGPRDIFATSVMKENFLANRRLLRHAGSIDGHVVIRVMPDARRFSVAVTGNADEDDRVKLVAGPYPVGDR